jgi:hypothetical protein
MSTTYGELTSGKSLDFEYQSCQLCGCDPWRWYKGVGEIHMDKGRVGEESKGKETDGYPLTHRFISLILCMHHALSF